MSEEINLDISELRRKRSDDGHSDGHQNGQHSGARSHSRSSNARANGAGARYASSGVYEPAPAPVNMWQVIEVLLRRWSWLLVTGAICGLAAFLVGLKVTNYTARVSLIRKENPNAFTAGGGDSTAPQAYISRELSPQTLFGMMRSPEVLKRVSEKAVPPVRPDRLARAVKVMPDRNPDFVTLSVSGKEPKETLARWANLYADEVVTYTRELQAEEAGSISDFLAMKLRGVEKHLADLNEQMARFSDRAQSLDVDKEVEAYVGQLVLLEAKADSARMDLETIDMRIGRYKVELARQTPANDRVNGAQDELDRLYARGYKDAHPEVIRQKALLEDLRRQGPSAATNAVAFKMPGGSLSSAIQFQILELEALKDVRNRELQQYQTLKKQLQDKAKTLSKTAVEYAQLKAGQKRTEDLRITLLSKQQEAQLLRDNALGYFKVYSYTSPQEVTGRKRLLAVLVLSAVGSLLGMLAAAGLALIAEALDNRVRSATDLERVTRLPVLATLGDLRKMTPEQQISWAFRTITILQGKLNSSSDETLVCGFISSRHEEGRSTWIKLLVSAASQRGMRVLTVATRPSTANDEAPERAPKDPALLPMGPATTLTKNVLAFPAQVVEQFNDPQAQPVVHIPLPGWVWNLERRQQWRTALEAWHDIRNLVLLIELPPACQPESVLLAEHVPQLIWLASSGMPGIEETRSQLETLRHARCNLVGAVLNREPSSFVRKHFSKWMRRFSVAALGSALCLQTLSAATPNEPAAAASTRAEPPPLSFSVNNPAQRPAWLQPLRLGPGDSVDISVFNRPELTRTNVVVGPDGRLNYINISELPAAGLTIDELRSQLDAELAKIYVSPRTIVTPVSFASKKYYVLGKVVSEGVYLLDRPLTIVEAVARAKGLQTGVERNGGEVADLSRSFLVRQGKRLPVDLERLFHEGDLSQNVPVEPGDYLYFAPGALPEIFVLGEVLSPGAISTGSGASLIAAISARGGFTEKAWRKKILVIRGSLQRPEAYAIDAPAILAGRTPDFKLEARDIVYVNARPWIRVEELMDIAAQAFIEASVTAWAGKNVPALFTSPVLPSL